MASMTSNRHDGRFSGGWRRTGRPGAVRWWLPGLFAGALACGGSVETVGAGGSATGGSASGGDETTTGSGAGGTSTTSTGGAGGTGGIPTGAGGGTGTSCDPGDVLCDAPQPSCPQGEVPSVVSSCWGPCVPILDCEPVASCEQCAGFCAAYVAFQTEYRCVAINPPCSAATCSCLSPYLCASPYDVCKDGGPDGALVSCGCADC